MIVDISAKDFGVGNGWNYGFEVYQDVSCRNWSKPDFGWLPEFKYKKDIGITDRSQEQ